MVFPGLNMLTRAVFKERSLIRCAAHSAFSSEQEIPQTFSVYVLKKVWQSLFPETRGWPQSNNRRENKDREVGQYISHSLMSSNVRYSSVLSGFSVLALVHKSV